MGAVISNRVYKNPYESSTVNFLVGNVGTWQTHEFDIETAVEIIGSLTETFSFPTPYTIKITSGKFWKDFGFDVGQTLVMEYDYFDGTTTTPNSWSQNITAINGSELMMDSYTVFAGFSVVPSDIGTKSVTNFKFYSTSNLDAISVKYGLIKNSTNQTSSINSFLDSTISEFVGLGLSVLSTGDVIDLIPVGTQSGMSINSVKLKYLSYSGYHLKWRVTIEFLIHGMYNTFPDFQLGISPDWFLNSESVTDNIDVKFFPQYNNPNCSIKNDMSWTRQLGNVGWFNENYNGLNDSFVVSNYSLSSGGFPVASILSNSQTDISLKISGLSNPSDPALKLGYGIMWASKDSDTFKNQKNPFHKNVKMNTGGLSAFSDSSQSVVDGIDITYRYGFSNDNARIDVNSVDWIVSGSDIILNLTVVPTNDFSDFIDINSDDKSYIFWVSIGDEDGTVNANKRVSKLVDFKEFSKIQEANDGPYDNMQIMYFDHGKSKNTTPDCEYDGYVEDDVLSQTVIAIDANKDIKIEKIEFKIEATDGTLRYALEEYGINYPLFMLDIDGLQILDFESSRNFKYNVGNEKNLIKVERRPLNDNHPLYYYNLFYGFKIRWEHWIQRVGVPSVFAKPIELNGFSNDWFDYLTQLQGSCDIVLAVYLKGTKGGVSFTSRNESIMTIRDYVLNNNYINHLIKTYDNQTNVLMTGGIDPETGVETNIIKSNGLTRIEVDYDYNVSDVSNIYGTICLEVWRGSGENDFRQISTIYEPETDNPLKPLVGFTKAKIEKVGPIIRVSCLVDPAFLSSDSKWKISSRLGCYIETCDGFVFTTLECINNSNNINLIPA